MNNSPANSPRNSGADEDVWIVPARWWAKALPIRGYGPAPRVRIDPEATARAQQRYDEAAEMIANALNNPASDPELAARGRAASSSEEPVDSLGQAVLATLVHNTVFYPAHADLLDLWVTRFGIRMTAQIVARMTNLGVVHSPAPGGRLYYEGRPGIAALNPDQMSGTVKTEHAASGFVAGFQPSDIHIRLRQLLAALPDDEYDSAVADLRAIRGRSRAIDAMITYLVPSDQAWLDEIVAALPPRRYTGDLDPLLRSLFASITDLAQCAALFEKSVDDSRDRAHTVWLIGQAPATLYSLGCHLGPSAATLLGEVADGNVLAKTRTLIYDILAHIPTDKAFDLLLDRLDRKNVEPAVLTAANRYPRRAMRLLAERATGQGASTRVAQRLLRDHARTHPELVDQLTGSLEPGLAQLLSAASEAAETLTVTPAEAIPPLLIDPPWAGYRRSKPAVLSVTPTPTPLETVWEAGERERWSHSAPHYPTGTPGPGWPTHLRFLLNHPRGLSVSVFSQAPLDMVRPHLAGAEPSYVWRALPDLQRILGRFDTDAVDYILAAVRSKPIGHAEALLPIEGSEVAALMAHLCNRRSTRPAAREWLSRHAYTAAHDLIPAALGQAGKNRTAADAALRLLGNAGKRDRVRAAAATYGPEVAAAIEAILTADPLLHLPTRMPALPSWLRVELLPPIRAVGRDDALPMDAVTNFCLMCALCEPDSVYAGFEHVAADLDATSLAEWARALFEQWRHAAYPAGQGWILTLQGQVGNDDTVRMLTPLIRTWPGQSAHKRAVAGLEVLADIGTDVALLHLHGISERLKFPALKATAAEKIEQIAVELDLTAEQLGDRLVPDCGLDDEALALDYGPRMFRIDFDEQLRPTIRDSDGALRKTLPKPGTKDDPQLAPAAYARFSALKKSVKTVAADQIPRLEKAMVTRRRWPAREFQDLFVAHPLLIRLARRLVWGTYDATDDHLTGAMRVNEDRTFTDATGSEIPWNEDAFIGIAHPRDLRESLPTWTQTFAEDEITQPFAQLARGVHGPTETECTDTRLTRFEGVTVTSAAIIGLERHGWVREDPQDAGMQISASKSLSGGSTVTIAFCPGISVGDPTMFPEQRIIDACVTPKPLGELHPVDASEVLRELITLTDGA